MSKLVIVILLIVCAVFAANTGAEIRTCSAMCLSRSFINRKKDPSDCVQSCLKHVHAGKQLANALSHVALSKSLSDQENEDAGEDAGEDAAAVDTNFALKASVGSHNVYGNTKGAFYKSELTIDADGAYRAYHPKNIGLDYLANAGSPGNWWALVTDNG